MLTKISIAFWIYVPHTYEDVNMYTVCLMSINK